MLSSVNSIGSLLRHFMKHHYNPDPMTLVWKGEDLLFEDYASNVLLQLDKNPVIEWYYNCTSDELVIFIK